ncbi:hypothetical protein [Sphaerochaeta sp. PS]|uniref:hypothetical protein n=1 Tax=Sphaerochaeta sp. PS TaxID=3076336 RepID=UPI0028A4D687|nr:hypothetical protein [Sphaerochaeta sp. PS]MDT4761664.1 hypothetical protein [Sphaerochaeta sp. PS]
MMKRFGLLVNREVQTGKRDLSIYALTIFLVLFASETINSFVAQYSRMGFAPAVYDGLFSNFLFIGGFIITSLSFASDMFSKNGQHEWLMLPATSFEKFMAKGVLSAFVYPIAIILLFFLTSVVTEPIQLLFFGNPVTLFNPFTGGLGSQLASYWVWQSVFLLGATYFHKGHFFKTVLSIGGIGIALATLGLLFVKIIFSLKYGSSLRTFDVVFSFDRFLLDPASGAIGAFRALGKILYYVALPIFCWVTAYFRVEEVQATDAV